MSVELCWFSSRTNSYVFESLNKFSSYSKAPVWIKSILSYQGLWKISALKKKKGGGEGREGGGGKIMFSYLETFYLVIYFCNGVADTVSTNDGDWQHWNNWQLVVVKDIYLNYLWTKTEGTFIRANRVGLGGVVYLMQSHLIEYETHLQLML